MPAPSLPSPVKLLADSFLFYKLRFTTLLKLVVAPLLLTLILVAMVAVIVATANLSRLSLPVQLLITVPALLVALVLATIFSLAGRTGLIKFIAQPESYTGIIQLFKTVWPLLWSFFLTQALAGLIILVGFLLIIPGIIFAIRFLFVPFVAVLEGKFGRQALAISRAYAQGRFWALAGRSLFIGAISIILSLASTQFDSPWLTGLFQLLMMLVVGPLTTIYFYNLYQACKLGVNDFAPSRPTPAPNS